jgi:hypothetical protein
MDRARNLGWAIAENGAVFYVRRKNFRQPPVVDLRDGKILENGDIMVSRKVRESFGPKGTTEKFPLEFAKPNKEMVKMAILTLHAQVKAAREAEATKG